MGVFFIFYPTASLGDVIDAKNNARGFDIPFKSIKAFGKSPKEY